MGHYDSYYDEADEKERRDREKKEFRDEIREVLKKNLSVEELEFLADVATHIKEYSVFFAVLRNNH